MATDLSDIMMDTTSEQSPLVLTVEPTHSVRFHVFDMRPICFLRYNVSVGFLLCFSGMETKCFSFNKDA